MLDLARRVIEAVESQIRIYPRNVNYASDAGHECERFLYLARVAWDKKTPHDAGTELIFRRGRLAEKIIDEELSDAGFQIVEHSRPYEWKKFQVRGKIDRKIMVNGSRYPL